MAKPTSRRALGKGLVLGGTVLLVVWLAGLAPFQHGVDPERGAAVDFRELPARPPGTDALIERLRRTNLLNGEEPDEQVEYG